MPTSKIEGKDSALQTKITLESLWDDVGFSPNAKQKEAIQAISGPLYLTAGPGSGKTSVLVWRTLNLLVFHNVSPERVFLGTFTEKGAHQLRERLRGILGVVTEKTRVPYDISKMAIGTVHSICHTLLTDRRLSKASARPNAPILLDQFAQYQFIYRAKHWSLLVERSGLGSNANSLITQYFENRTSESRHRAVTNAIGFFNRVSEEDLPLDPLKAPDDIAKGLLNMYSAYRELLATNKRGELCDLSLIQSHAYQRVKGSDFGDKLFQHVIVDEYQDTNAIQERIYFHLARYSKNLCVVGDDDQALYRFRGATVDNFLAFPQRCEEHLGVKARQIPLATNYRSRRGIVAFYNAFMNQFAWKRGRSLFRVEKTIKANSDDQRPAVFSADPSDPESVAESVAEKVRELVDTKRVSDPNEIAFLFPTLGSKCVERMKRALEDAGLKVYAPRAGNFIEQPESLKIFGVYLLIFGNPGHVHTEYLAWIQKALEIGKTLVREDTSLARFVKHRQDALKQVCDDERALLGALKKADLDEAAETTDAGLRLLMAVKHLSPEVKGFLSSNRLAHYVREQRKRRPDRPVTYRYIINRACSLDWGVLDLFYHLTEFDAFKEAFDSAQKGEDEGPICNLSVISDYLSRFQEQTSPVLSAQFLSHGKFARSLFSSFIYSIFRLEEGEFEDKEDPFPKGRIPFLTVHQAKGLEFPVVVLGNLRANDKLRSIEKLTAELGAKRLEPLDLAPTFDLARMFYVALSRAKQILILCPYKGRGQTYRAEFKPILQQYATPLGALRPELVDKGGAEEAGVPHPYSFTGDYIQYSICPRRYMLHRRYNFAPSRSQTTIFGNLVHRTIEDLHQFLIQARANGELGGAV